MLAQEHPGEQLLLANVAFSFDATAAVPIVHSKEPPVKVLRGNAWGSTNLRNSAKATISFRLQQLEHLFACLSTDRSTYPSIHLPIHQYIHPFIQLSVHLCIYLSFC